MHQHGDI